MKSKTLLQLFFAAALTLGFSASGMAQCNASFADTVGTNAYEIWLVNTSNNTSPNMVYYWSMPGGTPSADTTTNINAWPTVTYTSNAPQNVCLIAVDTSTLCSDTFCMNVYPQSFLWVSTGTPNQATCGQCNGVGVAYSGGGVPPLTLLWSNAATGDTIGGLCAGTYTVTVTDQNGSTATASAVITAANGPNLNVVNNNPMPCAGGSATLQGIASNGAAPYTYAWSNGATTSSTTVSTTGTYTITVTDANGCTAVGSTQVSVQGAITVSTSITDETCYNCCDGAISASASGGLGSYSYLWNTGATTSSISALCPGIYGVTVTDDSSGCSMVVTSLQVTAIPNPCPNGISGQITPVSEATAYLIQESGGVLSLVDSMDVDSIGQYYFGDLCGTFYVKAALRPVSSQYSNYLPTYYVGQALWANATSITPSGYVTANISLISGTNPGGPGFVGGLISQGANREEGDPIVGATVFLMDNNDEPLAFTTSDENGAYSFDGVALGEYKVMVDLLNFDAYPHTVTVAEGEVTFDEKDFVVEGGIVRPVEEDDDNSVGIGSGAETAGVSFFPNPANDLLTINGEGLTSITVYNLVGQQVMITPLNNQNQTELDVRSLAPGNYILEIHSLNGSSSHRLVKQ